MTFVIDLDTREERNLLLEDVYPRLKSHCKEQYGMDFQVITKNSFPLNFLARDPKSGTVYTKLNRTKLKISAFRVMGKKNLGRVGTHILFLEKI